GLINLDFADVKAVMSHAGSALMAIGRAAGEDRAVKAAQAAIASPLLEVSISGAKGVLFNIAGSDYTLHEVHQAASVIQEAADPDANIIFGAIIDERLQDELQITVIATGFEGRSATVRQGSARPLSRDISTGRQPSPERTAESRLEQPRTEPRSEPATRRDVRDEPSYRRSDFNDDDDEYDIPAFIRRR
ncbi:MAG: cell division protein FtsZ, partial [Chloroflexi bacterium]